MIKGRAMAEWLPFVITGMTSVAGAWLVAYFGMRSAREKVMADQEIGSGELALKIAEDLRGEQKDYRIEMKNQAAQVAAQLHELRRALREQTIWGDAVYAELVRVDPLANTRVPTRPELPF